MFGRKKREAERAKKAEESERISRIFEHGREDAKLVEVIMEAREAAYLQEASRWNLFAACPVCGLPYWECLVRLPEATSSRYVESDYVSERVCLGCENVNGFPAGLKKYRLRVQFSVRGVDEVVKAYGINRVVQPLRWVEALGFESRSGNREFVMLDLVDESPLYMNVKNVDFVKIDVLGVVS